ncbi:MAG: ShlB/FhaC/HecB family hemolysin secretion/activation protein, partial [Nostoc sp.]
GFPGSILSPGADEQGRTRVSALRFSQEWTSRNSHEVIALRSQFSLGIDALNATINQNPPDSRFFAWQGQAQWARLLAPETLLLLRLNTQLASRTLLPIEQFGLGGQDSVRGYRQD